MTTPNLSLAADGERWSRFVPLTKFDEETGIGQGTLALEELDKSGEIMDYAESKPHFVAWSESIQKASSGQSVGNLRAMHQLVAAGKFTKIDFVDERKAIDVEFKVVDEDAKKKCAEGVYTGLSIGGAYFKKWDDPTIAKAKRYVAKPSEGSLVDNPCMTNATFVYRKADGTEELRKFVGRQTRQVWTCGVPDHEHEMKADALKCDAVDSPALKVTVDVTEAAKIVKDALAKAASPDALKKCLYQIANLAGALEQIGWVHSAEQYEAETEADGSTVPDKIKAGITALFEALSAMVDEEAAEWTSEEGLAMAVTSTLEKINAKPERLRELLTKRAEEGQDMEAKDFQKVIGASEEKLAKLIGDGFAAIGSRVEKVEGTIQTVTERLEKVEKATPVPGGPVLRAVDKSADNAIGSERTEAVPQDTHGLVKSALRNPVMTIAGANRPR